MYIPVESFIFELVKPSYDIVTYVAYDKRVQELYINNCTVYSSDLICLFIKRFATCLNELLLTVLLIEISFSGR